MVEGMGGAMMTPVGRLILVRSVDRRELINAMVWVTLPALVGPLIGPPLGGFITTYISWHWIFLINIPIGVTGIVLATIFIEDVRAETPDPFDAVGTVLAGLGIGGLAFGGSVLGLNFLPLPVVIALIVVGATSTFAYVLHARRTPAPILDLSLLKVPSLRAAVIGGFVYRVRRRRDAVPAAAVVAARIRHDGVPFRVDHDRQRGRRHGDEDHHPDRAAALRLPPRAGGERGHQRHPGRHAARPSRRACRSRG